MHKGTPAPPCKMVEVIGAADGNYRNVGPPSIEELVKQVREAAWTRPVDPSAATVGSAK